MRTLKQKQLKKSDNHFLISFRDSFQIADFKLSHCEEGAEAVGISV